MFFKLPFRKPTTVDGSGVVVLFNFQQFVNEEEIGQGGFGTVYNTILQTGEKCEIKKMFRNGVEDKGNFVKEAQIL